MNAINSNLSGNSVMFLDENTPPGLFIQNCRRNTSLSLNRPGRSLSFLKTVTSLTFLIKSLIQVQLTMANSVGRPGFA